MQKLPQNNKNPKFKKSKHTCKEASKEINYPKNTHKIFNKSWKDATNEEKKIRKQTLVRIKNIKNGIFGKLQNVKNFLRKSQRAKLKN